MSKSTSVHNTHPKVSTEKDTASSKVIATNHFPEAQLRSDGIATYGDKWRLNSHQSPASFIRIRDRAQDEHSTKQGDDCNFHALNNSQTIHQDKPLRTSDLTSLKNDELQIQTNSDAVNTILSHPSSNFDRAALRAAQSASQKLKSSENNTDTSIDSSQNTSKHLNGSYSVSNTGDISANNVLESKHTRQYNFTNHTTNGDYNSALTRAQEVLQKFSQARDNRNETLMASDHVAPLSSTANVSESPSENVSTPNETFQTTKWNDTSKYRPFSPGELQLDTLSKNHGMSQGIRKSNNTNGTVPMDVDAEVLRKQLEALHVQRRHLQKYVQQSKEQHSGHTHTTDEQTPEMGSNQYSHRREFGPTPSPPSRMRSVPVQATENSSNTSNVQLHPNSIPVTNTTSDNSGGMEQKHFLPAYNSSIVQSEIPVNSPVLSNSSISTTFTKARQHVLQQLVTSPPPPPPPPNMTVTTSSLNNDGTITEMNTMARTEKADQYGTTVINDSTAITNGPTTVINDSHVINSQQTSVLPDKSGHHLQSEPKLHLEQVQSEPQGELQPDPGQNALFAGPSKVNAYLGNNSPSSTNSFFRPDPSIRAPMTQPAQEFQSSRPKPPPLPEVSAFLETKNDGQLVGTSIHSFANDNNSSVQLDAVTISQSSICQGSVVQTTSQDQLHIAQMLQDAGNVQKLNNINQTYTQNSNDVGSNTQTTHITEHKQVSDISPTTLKEHQRSVSSTRTNEYIPSDKRHVTSETHISATDLFTSIGDHVSGQMTNVINSHNPLPTPQAILSSSTLPANVSTSMSASDWRIFANQLEHSYQAQMIAALQTQRTQLQTSFERRVLELERELLRVQLWQQHQINVESKHKTPTNAASTSQSDTHTTMTSIEQKTNDRMASESGASKGLKKENTAIMPVDTQSTQHAQCTKSNTKMNTTKESAKYNTPQEESSPNRKHNVHHQIIHKNESLASAMISSASSRKRKSRSRANMSTTRSSTPSSTHIDSKSMSPSTRSQNSSFNTSRRSSRSHSERHHQSTSDTIPISHEEHSNDMTQSSNDPTQRNSTQQAIRRLRNVFAQRQTSALTNQRLQYEQTIQKLSAERDELKHQLESQLAAKSQSPSSELTDELRSNAQEHQSIHNELLQEINQLRTENDLLKSSLNEEHSRYNKLEQHVRDSFEKHCKAFEARIRGRASAAVAAARHTAEAAARYQYNQRLASIEDQLKQQGVEIASLPIDLSQVPVSASSDINAHTSMDTINNVSFDHVNRNDSHSTSLSSTWPTKSLVFSSPDSVHHSNKNLNNVSPRNEMKMTHNLPRPTTYTTSINHPSYESNTQPISMSQSFGMSNTESMTNNSFTRAGTKKPLLARARIKNSTSTEPLQQYSGTTISAASILALSTKNNSGQNEAKDIYRDKVSSPSHPPALTLSTPSHNDGPPALQVTDSSTAWMDAVMREVWADGDALGLDSFSQNGNDSGSQITKRSLPTTEDQLRIDTHISAKGMESDKYTDIDSVSQRHSPSTNVKEATAKMMSDFRRAFASVKKSKANLA